jgi:hypothetical protein
MLPGRRGERFRHRALRASLSRALKSSLRPALCTGCGGVCGLLGLGQRAGDDDGDGGRCRDVGVLENVDVAGDGEFWRVERCDDGVDTGGAGLLRFDRWRRWFLQGLPGRCRRRATLSTENSAAYLTRPVTLACRRNDGRAGRIEFGVGCFLSSDHAWTPCAAR